MENTKTLGKLKENAWYRLLIVIFFLCLLLTLAAFNFVVFSDGIKQIDSNKTQITCSAFDPPNSPQISFSPNEINTPLMISDFRNGKINIENLSNEYDLSRILNSCYSPTEATKDLNNIKEYMLGTGTFIPIYPGFENVDIHIAFTYKPFLELFLIGNFLILFAFKVARRVFYYIVLGKILPKK